MFQGPRESGVGTPTTPSCGGCSTGNPKPPWRKAFRSPTRGSRSRWGHGSRRCRWRWAEMQRQSIEIDWETPNYCVVGLGKLGACIAAVIQDRGHEVVGLDRDPAVVEAINGGGAPVGEPGLEQLISTNRDRLRATTDYADAIASSDV